MTRPATLSSKAALDICSTDESPTECTYCSRGSRYERPWWDWADVGGDSLGRVVAPLGCLLPGYVLILPARHVTSFCDLTDDELASARTLLGDLGEIYRDHDLQDVTVFEHGCRTGHVPVGCVDHAHWHVLPLDLDVSMESGWRAVDSFDEFRRSAPPEYVFVQNSTGCKVADQVPCRQYLRQLVAAQLGRGDEWDYVVFPHLEHLRATMEMLGSAFDDRPPRPLHG